MRDPMPQPKRNMRAKPSTSLRVARSFGYMWGMVGSTALIIAIIVLLYLGDKL